MRRAITVISLVVLAGCTTTFVEETAQTRPEAGSPTTSAQAESTTTAVSSPPATTALTTPPEAQEFFTTILRPVDLVGESTGENPATITALNADSGRTAWELPIPWAGWHWMQLEGAQIIHSSDRFDEVSVITAIGLDGTPRWRTTTELQTHGPFLVDGGLLIGSGAAPGNETESTVVFALDTADGSLQWSVEIDSRPQWGEDGSVVGSDGIAFVTGMEGKAIAIDSTTGALMWEVQLSSEVIDASHPIGDLLLIGAYGTLIAVDAASGEVVWTTQPDGRLIASPEGVAGGNAVAWHGNLETGFAVSGINPSDGSIVWTDSCYRQFEVFSDFVVGFEPDAAFDWPQTVRVWEGASGNLLAEQPVGADIDPFSISANESTVFVGTNNGILAAIDVDGDRTAWTTTLRGAVMLTTVHDGAVFASASDRQSEMRGAVHAVEAATGSPIWTTDLTYEARTAPIIAGGLVLVVSAEEFWGTF